MLLSRKSAVILSMLALAACGGGGGGGGGGGPTSPPPPPPEPTNSAPTFTSPIAFTFDENQPVSFNITVNDPDGDAITISDDTTGDGALFTVDVNSGSVTANTPDGSFDFEAPQDVNGDNVYEQNITLSDGTVTVTETITVTIVNVDEAPTCAAPEGMLSFDENFTGNIFTFTGADPEGEAGTFGDAFFSNGAGFDPYNDQFAFDTATGTVSVTEAFDFEALQDGLTFSVSASYTVGTQSAQCSATYSVRDLVGAVASGIRIEGQPTSAGKIQLAAPLLDVDGRGRADHFIEKTVTDDADVQQPGGYILYGEALAGLLADDDGATLDVSTLTASQGVFLTKPNMRDPETQTAPMETITAASLSDMDGDGVREIMIGISQSSAEAGTELPIAYIVYGSVFSDQTLTELDLTSLTDAQGITVTAPAGARDFETGFDAGDLDGDGVLDAVITLLDGDLDGHTYILRGSGLQTQLAADAGFSLAGQTTDLVVEMFEGETDGFFQGGHRFTTILDDVLGDGRDELVVSTNSGYLLITSEAVTDTITSGRQSYLSLINDELVIQSDLDFNINEPRFARTKVDLDADGLPELAFAFEESSGKIGGVVYGDALRNQFPGAGSTFPKTELEEAIEEFISFPFVGSAVLGDMTGDGQPEVAFGDGSRVYIVTENVLDPATDLFDLGTLMAGEGVTLTGTFDVSGLGRGLSALDDISGDGLPELVILDPRSSADFGYIVRSDDLSEALADGTTEIALETLFNNESPVAE